MAKRIGPPCSARGGPTFVSDHPTFRLSDLPTPEAYDGILSRCPIRIFERVERPLAVLRARRDTP